MTLIACTQCGSPLQRTLTHCPHCGHRRWHNLNRRQRGYTHTHDKLRAHYQALLRRGDQINCARCGQPVKSDDRWHLDHTTDRHSYLGPSHAVCNEGKLPLAPGAGGDANTTDATRHPAIVLGENP
jgi:DNA-directed RNA polymerase subunit RPC12/RpoP